MSASVVKSIRIPVDVWLALSVEASRLEQSANAYVVDTLRERLGEVGGATTDLAETVTTTLRNRTAKLNDAMTVSVMHTQIPPEFIMTDMAEVRAAEDDALRIYKRLREKPGSRLKKR